MLGGVARCRAGWRGTGQGGVMAERGGVMGERVGVMGERGWRDARWGFVMPGGVV